MKQLTCEMCGSTDLMKQDGVFVCQSCGTKYSVEEAKKMMGEGSVDSVINTVRVDISDELKNLYLLARRARDENNSENAQKYYEQILLKDPTSWEASFYSVYYQSMNCKIGEIQSAAIRVSNCEETVLNLINENISDSEEQRKYISEIAMRLISISNMLFLATAKDYTDSIYGNITGDAYVKHIKEGADRFVASMNIVYNYGNCLVKLFGDMYGDIVVDCWKGGVEEFAEFNNNNNMFTGFDYRRCELVAIDYVDKIKKYDPSYQIYIKNNEGCYVATAIYGSYDCPQVWTLRRFRDYTLAETWYGRAFIRTYYAISPTLVKWFGHTEWFKKMWKGKLDRMVANLKAKGVEDTPYEDRLW